MHKIQPPLKWAGGKRWLVPYIKTLWLTFQESRLVEPFCGGLAIALGLMPKKALLNDINPHLINFYEWLKKGLKAETSFQNTKEIYYEYRKEFNGLIFNGQEKSKKAAELFYYLNKTCFNGLCRFNRGGEYNVPFGQHKTINYIYDFMQFKEILSNWDFSSESYLKVELRSEDFIFADPPYDVNFTEYSKDGFSWRDQVELCEWISYHKGPIIMCNQATERIIDLYKSNGFDLHYIKERIFVKANGDRTPADVVIAIKNLNFDFQEIIAL